ncbi:hypothetical protein LCGC14_1646840, partial [marine sediment metagenome]
MMECEWCEKDIPEGVAYINAPIYYLKSGWVDVFYHLSCLPAIRASISSPISHTKT